VETAGSSSSSWQLIGRFREDWPVRLHQGQVSGCSSHCSIRAINQSKLLSDMKTIFPVWKHVYSSCQTAFRFVAYYQDSLASPACVKPNRFRLKAYTFLPRPFQPKSALLQVDLFPSRFPKPTLLAVSVSEIRFKVCTQNTTKVFSCFRVLVQAW
jgi:hypothetical protein